MRILVFGLTLLLAGSVNATHQEPELEVVDLGNIKATETAEYRLSRGISYFIDRQNQQCFAIRSEYYIESSHQEGSGMTKVECEDLRATPEIDEFLKGGKQL